VALTEHQKHLLNRLPNWYEVRKSHEPKEPANVIRARKLIEEYTEGAEKERKDREDRFKKALNDVCEAIYFLTADKALLKVKAFEAEFGMK
jgi:nitrogenase molybdenum-iron protein alpha/beta subunit